MSHLAGRMARTDRHIRELTERIELYRNRVARKSRNPALAAQANQLLPAMCAKREELVRYRKSLLHALELEAYLSPDDDGESASTDIALDRAPTQDGLADPRSAANTPPPTISARRAAGPRLASPSPHLDRSRHACECSGVAHGFVEHRHQLINLFARC